MQTNEAIEATNEAYIKIARAQMNGPTGGVPKQQLSPDVDRDFAHGQADIAKRLLGKATARTFAMPALKWKKG